MKSITLPNRNYNDVKLLYIKREGDFYVFKPNNHFAWKYCGCMYSDTEHKNQIGIDPEGGPFMMIGYKINGMILDHFDDEGNLYMTKKTSYKIAAMSDLHGYLPEIEPCDIVCICGDIVPLEIQRNYIDTFNWLKNDFFHWAENLPCEKVFWIGGNHDFFIEQLTTKAINRIAREELYNNKVIYLNNTLYTEYDNLRIYGCPNVENLTNWAFYTDDPLITYSKIPQCDILLTHMPPDIQNLGTIQDRNFGSKELAKLSDSRNIKYWFCGHIHDGNHSVVENNGCKIYNTALKNDDYNVVYPITYVNLNK